MADPHLAIYNKLEDIDNTLNSLKEANDVEPVLNDISITLKNIDESLAILRRELDVGDYMNQLSLLTDIANDLGSLTALEGIFIDLASAVDFIANQQ